MGMGAYRDEERLMCAAGLSNSAPVRFESCEGVANGGVMLLLPFLFESGLMSYGKHYSPRKSGYYTFDNLVIIIAIMFLCRIKNFEQIKQKTVIIRCAKYAGSAKTDIRRVFIRGKILSEEFMLKSINSDIYF